MAAVTAALGGSGGTAPALGGAPGGGPGSDTTAIHDNVAGEIAAIANKATVADGDYVLIEDSADSNNKKHVLASLLTGGSVARAILPSVNTTDGTATTGYNVLAIGNIAYFGFAVPADATGALSLHVNYFGSSSTTYVLDVDTFWGSDGESTSAGSDTMTDSSAVTLGLVKSVDASAALTGVAAGDSVNVLVTHVSGTGTTSIRNCWMEEAV